METIQLFLLLTWLAIVHGYSLRPMEYDYKPVKKLKSRSAYERSSSHWQRDAQWTLSRKIQQPINTNRAKNIVLFLGDGMSISTLAACRPYIGRELGLGEETVLSFEHFPYTGLAKTYCLDKQVADSACSGTAYLCGVKANYGTIGLNGGAKRGVCSTQLDHRNHVDSIAAWAQKAGKKTGVVTTTRVTHASPASAYAHAAERGWESDADFVKRGGGGGGCTDIATQLVRGPVGSKLNVVLGGGRKNFIPKTSKDPEGNSGVRYDGVDLISQWVKSKEINNSRPAYVYNRKGLMDLNVTKYDYLLGLFEPDHMQYHLDADPEEDPSLEEMVVKALDFLSYNSSNGYFLFIEGGKIDIAHHETKARKALDETAEFNKAVEAALRMIDLNETLILVTADHSHTMTYNGYNTRGSNVLGHSENVAHDGLPYMILSYANGPGYRLNDEYNQRYDVTNEDIEDRNFQFPALVPLMTETHGGEDVAIYANGPWSHLFTGNWEQSFIPYAMAYAACIGPDITACDLFDVK